MSTLQALSRFLMTGASVAWIASGVFASAQGSSGVQEIAGTKQGVQETEAPTPLPPAFQRYDLDRDGVLSDQEREAARAAIQGKRERPSSNAPIPRSKEEIRRQEREAQSSQRTPTTGVGESKSPEKSAAGKGRRDAESTARSAAKRSASQQAKARPVAALADGTDRADKRRAAIQRKQGDVASTDQRRGAQGSQAERAKKGKSSAGQKNPSAAEQKASAAKRAAALRAQQEQEAAAAAIAAAEAAELARQEMRRVAVRSELVRRRTDTGARLQEQRALALEREAKISHTQAWNSISKMKSKPVATPKLNFRPEKRNGVTRGKKRGSKYYSKQIKRAAGNGNGRGRRGNRNRNRNNNNNNF